MFNITRKQTAAEIDGMTTAKSWVSAHDDEVINNTYHLSCYVRGGHVYVHVDKINVGDWWTRIHTSNPELVKLADNTLVTMTDVLARLANGENIKPFQTTI